MKRVLGGRMEGGKGQRTNFGLYKEKEQGRGAQSVDDQQEEHAACSVFMLHCVLNSTDL